MKEINQLIKGVKENNSEAQMKIYERFVNTMFTTAKRILKDDQMAEDIVQESFIIAFQKINDFKGKVTFGAWLKRIVINQSISYSTRTTIPNKICDIYINPGKSDVDDIKELFESLSELNKSLGGNGLIFSNSNKTITLELA